MKLNFFKSEIVDKFVRENFQKLESYFIAEPFSKGNFKFLEIVLAKAASNKAVAHNLTYAPKDVILLSVLSPDTATVTWHYDLFDRQFIYITTSAACTVRAYIGRYGES